MLSLIGKRLLAIIPLFFLITLITYSLVELVPGDPAETLAGEFATPEDIEALRKHLGLSAPLVVRYLRFLGRLLQGDFGSSLRNSQPVLRTILDRAPATLSLVLVSLSFSIVVSALFGSIAAVRRNSWIDRVIVAGVTAGMAVPSFLIGVLLITYLAVNRSWFPATGFAPLGGGVIEWFKSLVLPGIALGVVPTAELTRQIRSAMRETLDQDYIRTARAKGLRPGRVVLKHAAKNAAVPVVTVLGVQMGRLLGGAAVIETVFAFPGIGTLAISAVQSGDVSVVQGIVMLGALTVILVNLLVDISYAYFNPKLRS